MKNGVAMTSRRIINSLTFFKNFAYCIIDYNASDQISKLKTNFLRHFPHFFVVP